jgi:hypothetical protein
VASAELLVVGIGEWIIAVQAKAKARKLLSYNLCRSLECYCHDDLCSRTLDRPALGPLECQRDQEQRHEDQDDQPSVRIDPGGHFTSSTLVGFPIIVMLMAPAFICSRMLSQRLVAWA